MIQGGAGQQGLSHTGAVQGELTPFLVSLTSDEVFPSIGPGIMDINGLPSELLSVSFSLNDKYPDI